MNTVYTGSLEEHANRVGTQGSGDPSQPLYLAYSQRSPRGFRRCFEAVVEEAQRSSGVLIRL